MIDGLFVIDKPSGLTSHDVVARCRRVVKQKRIGHAGTLDPGATGVLLVAMGRATRLMRYVSELRKSYVGEVVLGATTTTLDDEGDVVETFAMDNVSLEDVRIAAEKFVGDILQIPPMVSAVKVDGKRLHELARAGIEVERKPRPVSVYRIEVDATDEPHVFRLSVDCSSGTYIRTLAADIGEALGGGAHLRRLRRTAIGEFSVDHSRAVSLEALMESWEPHLLPAGAMVAHLESFVADEEITQRISHGKSLPDREGEGPWAVFDAEGSLLAVYARVDDKLRPDVVLVAG